MKTKMKVEEEENEEGGIIEAPNPHGDCWAVYHSNLGGFERSMG